MKITYHIEVSADGKRWGGLREVGPKTLEEARERRAQLSGKYDHVRIVQTTVEVVE